MSQDKLTDCPDGFHCETPPQSANFDDANEDTKLITNSDITYPDPVTSSIDHLASYDAISETFEPDPEPTLEPGEEEVESLFIGQEETPAKSEGTYDITYVRDVAALRDVNVSATASQFEASHRAAKSCELLHQGPTFSVEQLNHHASKSCEILNQPANFDLNTEDALGLTFEDFWPKATVEAWRIEDASFECFSEVVERASSWLRDHGDLRLLNCETSEKKITNLEELYSDLLQYTDKGCTPVLVKGLRLWLIPRCPGANDNNNKSMLRFVDIVPQCTAPGNQDVVTLADFYDDLEDAGHGKPQYETLGDALDRYNSSLAHTPLKGRIITVETVGLTISRDKWDGNLDPLKCNWVDRWLRDRFFLLRVWYLTGPPAHERIGLADFVPDQDKDANPLSLRTSLSRFDTLVEQARDWLNTIQGIRVTNVQTVDTKFTRSVEFPSLNTKQNESEKLQTQQAYEYSIETRPRALFLRVAYVLPTEGSAGSPGVIEWPLPLLNCHTFEPAYENSTNQSGDPFMQLEGLSSLNQHASAWLVRKGARAICAQVIQIPQGYDEKTDLHQRTLYSGEYEDGYERVERLNCIQLLRVFMDGPSEIAYTEDGTLSVDDMADVADEYDTLNEPSCCSVQ